MTSNVLLILSFSASLVPALILLIEYAFRTKWEKTVAGRTLFFMAVVLVLSYSISVLTLLFPSFFHDTQGEAIRIVLRFLLSVMQWSLLWLFYRAQKTGKSVYTKRKEQL